MQSMQDIHAPRTDTGAFEAARALRANGVDRVFGVCGDHINALYHALASTGIDIVGTRSEAAAVQMADGYARATGRAAVVAVTGGPGHTNAITGLSVAQSAQSPVVLISGLTPVTQRERVGQQVLHQAEMVKSVTKWAMEVDDADHVAQYVARALTVASEGTPGPVSLSIPVNVFTQPTARSPAYEVAPRPVQHHSGSKTFAAGLHDLAARIAQAQRPVVVLGSGVRAHGAAAEFLAAMQRLALPVFTIDQARGLVPDDGVVGFGYADPLFNPVFRELREADLLILAGARVDFHLCFGASQLVPPQIAVAQITSDPAHLDVGRRADLAILGDARMVLTELANSTAPADRRPAHAAWSRHLQQRFHQWRDSWSERLGKLERPEGSDGVHPLELCMSLQRHFTDHTAVMIDAGDFVHWARSFFPARKPGHFTDAVLTGNLGGALPLGMGTQMAFPEDPTWVFIGDGGFAFCGWDLSVAVERKLPIKVIVGNDASWGIEKRLQLQEFGAHYGCDLPRIRYDRFAELLGARGLFVSTRADLDSVVDEFCRLPGPCLLNVELTPMAGRPLNDFARYPRN
jgi:acetolactate synthase-1/2/3 large subunit